MRYEGENDLLEIDSFSQVEESEVTVNKGGVNFEE